MRYAVGSRWVTSAWKTLVGVRGGHVSRAPRRGLAGRACPLLVLQLETRLVPALYAVSATEQISLLAADQPGTAVARQVVFVENDIAGYQTLAQGRHADADLVVLDSGGDGLRQMNAFLSQHPGYQSLALVTHGSSAALDLGTQTLTTAALQAEAPQLRTLGSHLALPGQILLYSCDVAAGPAGQAFVSQLAADTGTAVAAATHLVGATRQGGNWDLDYHVGTSTATLPFDASAFQGVLTSSPSTEVDPGASSTLDGRAVSASVERDAAGNILGIDLTFSGDLVRNPPTTSDDVVLSLPVQAAATPFTELQIGYEPNGHPPPGIYTFPHFDFHFYTISDPYRLSIPGGPAPADPGAQFRPAGYAAPAGVVPEMGAHSYDLTGPEFHGGTFSQTFMYGFYNSQIAFLEAAMTPSYLSSVAAMANPQAGFAIRQPSQYALPQLPTEFPTAYRISYNSTADTYTVSIRQFLTVPAATSLPASGGTITVGLPPQPVRADTALNGTVQLFDQYNRSLGFLRPYGRQQGRVGVLLADLNGDGVQDIITWRQGHSVKVYDGRTLQRVRRLFPFGRDHRGKLHVSLRDVNGDGRLDLVIQSGGQTKVYPTSP